MAHSDSEDEVEAIDDLDFDVSEPDDVNEEYIINAEGEVEEGTSGAEEESGSGDSDEDGDDDDDDDEEQSVNDPGPLLGQQTVEQPIISVQPDIQPVKVEPARPRSLTPSHQRRNAFVPRVKHPKSYTVEAICAIAHPEPTHALASSTCMTHVITGSDDGYIRDYDVFTAVNGSTVLSQPQRHHCGVVEGNIKAGHLRCWWENPAGPNALEEPLSPIFSLAMHSDALWALSGSKSGYINLFTVRHDPGRFITSLHGKHQSVVSSLALAYDEMSCFSAGWDGEVYNWDLNTGVSIRKFRTHGAQMTTVAVRPYSAWIPLPEEPHNPGIADENDYKPQTVNEQNGMGLNEPPYKIDPEDDAKSDASFDPLFDDETDAGDPESQTEVKSNINARQLNGGSHPPQRNLTSTAQIANARGPPLLDSTSYANYSPDILLTASIDGQIILWDRRIDSPSSGVGRLEMSDKTPPWCVSACWSVDGGQVYAGRRNGTVDVWDTRQFGRSRGGTPRLLKSLRNPVSSGPVSCVVAFPDGNHIACASNDNIRLWNANDTGESRSGVPFKIIPGHHGGQISQMIVDSASRFLITSSSNRGWQGDSTKTVLIHDVKFIT